MSGKSLAGQDPWERMSPEEGAREMVARFGDAAVAEGIRLALGALAVGDEEGYRFWTAVYARIFAAGFR